MTDTTTTPASTADAEQTQAVPVPSPAPSLAGRECVDVDPTSLILGDNVRAAAHLDRQFLASLRQFGVMDPIHATRSEDGTLTVKRGQRRTLGAVKVGPGQRAGAHRRRRRQPRPSGSPSNGTRTNAATPSPTPTGSPPSSSSPSSACPPAASPNGWAPPAR